MGLFERLILSQVELMDAPDWVQMVPPGEVKPSGKDPFINDAEARRLTMEAWKARTNDAVLDYEHQTLSGSEAPAAGWIEELADRGDGEGGGIWGRVRWNDRAASYLKNREYRYLSPVVMIRKKDRRAVEFLNAALTNMPAIDGMEPVVNKLNNPSPSNGRGAGGEGDINGGNPKTEEEVVEMKWLKELLGLPETADETTVQAACKALFGFRATVTTALALREDVDGRDAVTAIEALKAEVPGELATALGLSSGATLSVCKGTVLGLKETAKDGGLAGEVAALKARQARKDADDAVMAALKDGKVTPANEGWAREYAEKDLDGFLAYCKVAPKVVGGVIKTVEGQGGGAMDDTAMAVCKQLGIKPEAFKATADKKGGTE